MCLNNFVEESYNGKYVTCNCSFYIAIHYISAALLSYMSYGILFNWKTSCGLLIGQTVTNPRKFQIILHGQGTFHLFLSDLKTFLRNLFVYNTRFHSHLRPYAKTWKEKKSKNGCNKFWRF